MVECLLPKQKVASSNLVSRSSFGFSFQFFFFGLNDPNNPVPSEGVFVNVVILSSLISLAIHYNYLYENSRRTLH